MTRRWSAGPSAPLSQHAAAARCAATPLPPSGSTSVFRHGVHTWLAYVRWKADLSVLRSLNCSSPTSPSTSTVSCAVSAGIMSCTRTHEHAHGDEQRRRAPRQPRAARGQRHNACKPGTVAGLPLVLPQQQQGCPACHTQTDDRGRTACCSHTRHTTIIRAAPPGHARRCSTGPRATPAHEPHAPRTRPARPGAEPATAARAV